MRYTIEQKTANAIKWIDGLKTTKVKQGTGKLGNSKTGYCCLGYGCMKLKIDYDIEDGESEKFQQAVGLKRADGAGTKTSLKTIDDESSIDSLIDANDDYNLSFRKIHTLIKNNIDNLFTKKVAKDLKAHYEK